MISPRKSYHGTTDVQRDGSSSVEPRRAVLVVAAAAAQSGRVTGPRVLAVGDELAVVRAEDRAAAVRAPGQATGAWSVPDRLVSARHARIARAGNEYQIEDLGSTNGTRVDGQRIAGPHTLREGAIVCVGGHLAVFRTVSEPALAAIAAEAAAPFGPVATASPVLALVVEKLRRLAAWEGELLLVGETGVGKEIYARAVHAASGRAGAFVPINCAAIPSELLESELFGYVRGAHSTAVRDKAGLLEAAGGGTAFLDEVGDMAPELQAKLLRFLQDHVLMPLGATRGRPIDARVVAATQENALDRLRPDLAARLGAEPLRLPPLRERIEDLGILVAHALGSSPKPLTPAALQALALYAWPRNVRELVKVVETAAVLAAGAEAIDLPHLPEAVAAATAPPPLEALATSAGEAAARKKRRPAPPAQELEALLAAHKGNVAEVARALDRKWQVVWRWLQQHGLDPNKYRGT